MKNETQKLNVATTHIRAHYPVRVQYAIDDCIYVTVTDREKASWRQDDKRPFPQKKQQLCDAIKNDLLATFDKTFNIIVSEQLTDDHVSLISDNTHLCVMKFEGEIKEYVSIDYSPTMMNFAPSDLGAAREFAKAEALRLIRQGHELVMVIGHNAPSVFYVGSGPDIFHYNCDIDVNDKLQKLYAAWSDLTKMQNLSRAKSRDVLKYDIFKNK